MTETEQRLLAEIAANPDDDAPRLVYADLLIERGDPRGEFIRLQCGEQTQERRDQAEALLRAHGAAWTAEAGLVKAYFQRGFPTSLFAACDKLVAQAEGLRTQPITKLSLYGGYDQLAALAALPALQRIQELELYDGGARPVKAIAPEHLQALASSPHLGGLRRLFFHEHTLSDAGARALAAARWWPRIRELLIANNAVGDAGLPAIVEQLVDLRFLFADETNVGPETMRALARSGVRGLEELLLAGTRPGDGMCALADSPVLATVTRLDLARTYVGDAVAQALARSPYAGALRELDLTSCRIEPAGARALAESTALRSLAKLQLRNNLLTAEGVDALAAGTGLPALRELSLDDNEVRTDRLVTFEAGSEAAGDYYAGAAYEHETREQLAARFRHKPHVKIT
ncbi:MAG TPA: TIGR02996 domain-containing protein [Kofleriaceae bacterium]|nr:TIGR02996 domain-containing protein [Kofleriaceae bacterium]